MLYSFVFHCDFSNPNRITSPANPHGQAVRVLYSSQGVESSLSKALAAIQNRHSAQQNGGLLRDDDGPRRQGCASKASKSHSRAGSKQSKASKSHFRACSKSQPLSDICPI